MHMSKRKKNKKSENSTTNRKAKGEKWKQAHDPNNCLSNETSITLKQPIMSPVTEQGNVCARVRQESAQVNRNKRKDDTSLLNNTGGNINQSIGTKDLQSRNNHPQQLQRLRFTP